MKKAIYYLDKYFEEVVLSCIMAYFVFATALQVVARFVLKTSMPWTEETARYALIWMTFLGSAFAAKRGTHIRVDILESLMKKNGHYMRAVAFLIFFAFTVMMTIAGIKICMALAITPQYSTILKIPMMDVYLALPVGMGLTAFRIIQKMWRDFRKNREGGETK